MDINSNEHVIQQSTSGYAFEYPQDEAPKDEIEFDRTDILAFVIACFQVIMPLALLVLGAFTVVMLFIQYVWLR